jgi:hypothetical protein
LTQINRLFAKEDPLRMAMGGRHKYSVIAKSYRASAHGLNELIATVSQQQGPCWLCIATAAHTLLRSDWRSRQPARKTT